MEAHGWTQTAMHDETGVHQTQISAYLDQKVLPTPSVLARLMATIPEGPQLLAAWLRDKIPEGFAEYVSISTSPDHGGAPNLYADEPGATLRVTEEAPASDSMRDLLEATAIACKRNPEFVTALESIIALARARLG